LKTTCNQQISFTINTIKLPLFFFNDTPQSHYMTEATADYLDGKQK